MKKGFGILVRTSTIMVSLFFIFFASSLLVAQNTDDIHLFQSYFFDATISQRPYFEGGLSYSDFDTASVLAIGGQGGFPINKKLEVQAALSYINISPEQGDGQSGISDLSLYGRYNLSNNGKTIFSAGGMITLPVGSEDVGKGNTNFEGFGAVRHKLQSGLTLTGTAGLLFFKNWEDDYDTSFNIGFGGIYPVNNLLAVVGEFNMQTEGDYMMVSAGVDYKLSKGHVRGALGLGLDDGAPDIQIYGSYLVNL